MPNKARQRDDGNHHRKICVKYKRIKLLTQRILTIHLLEKCNIISKFSEKKLSEFSMEGNKLLEIATNSNISDRAKENPKEQEALISEKLRSTNDSMYLTEAREESLRVKIADLGNACFTDHHYTDDVQTRQYRSPEVILQSLYGTAIDIWSLGCVAFEIFTGDFLFEPKSGTKYCKDEDHLAQMIELLGKFSPVAITGKRAREFFNKSRNLRHISELRMWGLEDVLSEKYGLPNSELESFVSFLKRCLEIEPKRRATARELLMHPWLQDLPE